MADLLAALWQVGMWVPAPLKTCQQREALQRMSRFWALRYRWA